MLIAPDGRIFVDMTGQHTRKDLIDDLNQRYSMGLTEEEKVLFANSGSFGVPMNRLKQWLNLEHTQRDQISTGIPVDTVDINKSELATWVHNARLAQFRMKQEGKVKDEYVVVIKADKTTPYPAVQKVFNTLTDINVNKFNLITNMEADPNKEEAPGKKG
jgi:Biopolymer transport protein